MPADFQIKIGETGRQLLATASLAGAPVPFPTGTVIAWSCAPGTAIVIGGLNSANPLPYMGAVATDPASPAVITLVAITPDGKNFTKTHTLDVLPASGGTIDAVDFTA